VVHYVVTEFAKILKTSSLDPGTCRYARWTK